MNYLYDETFDGFLTCVYHHWYTERADGIFPERHYQLDLTRYAMSVESDPEKAERVLGAVNKKISRWDAQRVYRAFCTNDPEKEMKLLRYIQLGFRHGPRIRLLHGDAVVKEVEAAEQRLGREVHRLCGLVRFSEVCAEGAPPDTGGAAAVVPAALLYAKIEPDNDVLEFIAPHFADRFKEEPFLIHDLSREKALFAYRRKWEIAPFPKGAPAFADTGGELRCHALWKEYFGAMAIKERKNPLCQRRFMPARYWKYLPEI